MLYLVFEAGGHRLAVPTLRVVEVVPRANLRSVPDAPAYMSGLLNHSGRLVPVVDLDTLMGGKSGEDRLGARIILIDRAEGKERIGFGVSRVDRVRTHEQATEPATGDGRLGSILQWPDDVAMLIDVDWIAENDVGSALLNALPQRSAS